jgi:CS domain
VANAIRQATAIPSDDEATDGGGGVDHVDSISFVLVPADTSRPLEQRTVKRPPPGWSPGGDYLVEYLITEFQCGGDNVDLSLLQQSATTTLASAGGNNTSVSQDTLRQVAMQGSVETFSLVHAVPSNNFTAVNIYLDEAGMLKRMPLNTRATDWFAKRAGYQDPPPQFFGNVFLGRVVQRKSIQTGRPMVVNESFVLGRDTALDAPWLQAAATDNLSYQMEMNKITGRTDQQQPKVAGQDGVAKTEADGFSWTQTEQEIEMSIPLPTSSSASDSSAGAVSVVKTKDIQVKFRPLHIQVKVLNKELLAFALFEHVDPDGCTWTLDRKNDTDVTLLSVTMEKAEAAFWPRIKD